MEVADQAEVKLDRPIGLAGGVALVIGGVMGVKKTATFCAIIVCCPPLPGCAMAGSPGK